MARHGALRQRRGSAACRKPRALLWRLDDGIISWRRRGKCSAPRNMGFATVGMGADNHVALGVFCAQDIAFREQWASLYRAIIFSDLIGITCAVG